MPRPASPGSRLFPRLLRQALALAVILLTAAPATAAPPWASLVPFSKKVEADPDNPYELDETHGPWMIMCASFAGQSAEQQAHDLVLELRQRLRLEAYTFRQTFDFSKPIDGNGWSKFGGPRKMKYLNSHKFDEIAVLVGHFQAVDSPQIEAALDKIKYADPTALNRGVKDSSQRFAGLRHIYRLVNLDAEKRSKGPMGAAFITRNPLLPEELFAAKGLDPFVVEMNKDLPHSLLKCRGKYSVRVASFRGVDTMKPDLFAKLTSDPNRVSKIDQAAINASRMCAALREKGVEAYEFHDRTESIVTIGSFELVGTERPDGKTEIHPGIHRIMQEYGPIEQARPGSPVAEVYSRTLNGIPFDPQPLPVLVPRESIAATYDPSNSLLR
jgi:hypothetical protein